MTAIDERKAESARRSAQDAQQRARIRELEDKFKRYRQAYQRRRISCEGPQELWRPMSPTESRNQKVQRERQPRTCPQSRSCYEVRASIRRSME